MITTTSSLSCILSVRRLSILFLTVLLGLSACTEGEPEYSTTSSTKASPDSSRLSGSDKMRWKDNTSRNANMLREFETVAYRLNETPYLDDRSKEEQTRIVGRGIIRKSSSSRANTTDTSVYVSISFEPISTRISRGSIVTIVPIDSELEPVSVRLNSVEKIESCFGNVLGDYEWSATSVLIPHDEYPGPEINSEKEIRVAVLYPPSRVVYHQQDRYEGLPEGYSQDVLRLSLDLDGDRDTDALMFSHCCARPSESPNVSGQGCSSCSDAYVKVGNHSEWRKTWLSGPC